MGSMRREIKLTAFWACVSALFTFLASGLSGPGLVAAYGVSGPWFFAWCICLFVFGGFIGAVICTYMVADTIDENAQMKTRYDREHIENASMLAMIEGMRVKGDWAFDDNGECQELLDNLSSLASLEERHAYIAQMIDGPDSEMNDRYARAFDRLIRYRCISAFSKIFRGIDGRWVTNWNVATRVLEESYPPITTRVEIDWEERLKPTMRKEATAVWNKRYQEEVRKLRAR